MENSVEHLQNDTHRKCTLLKVYEIYSVILQHVCNCVHAIFVELCSFYKHKMPYDIVHIEFHTTGKLLDLQIISRDQAEIILKIKTLDSRDTSNMLKFNSWTLLPDGFNKQECWKFPITLYSNSINAKENVILRQFLQEYKKSNEEKRDSNQKSTMPYSFSVTILIIIEWCTCGGFCISALSVFRFIFIHAQNKNLVNDQKQQQWGAQNTKINTCNRNMWVEMVTSGIRKCWTAHAHTDKRHVCMRTHTQQYREYVFYYCFHIIKYIYMRAFTHTRTHYNTLNM